MQFRVADSDMEFTIFTTRADTIFGVTFMVLAPESEWVDRLTTPEQRAAVDEYLAQTKKKTERERIAAEEAAAAAAAARLNVLFFIVFPPVIRSSEYPKSQ